MVMTDLSQISSKVTAYLVDEGVHAVNAFEGRKQCDHCVVVVSLNQCQVDSAGMGDYLGVLSHEDEEVEIYGKRCTLSLGLGFYAPVTGGERKIQKELDRVLGIVSHRESGLFCLRELVAEETGVDSVTKLLRRNVTLKTQVYLYYRQGSGEPLMDFTIKGVLKNASND